jgi:hypothetical protein
MHEVCVRWCIGAEFLQFLPDLLRSVVAPASLLRTLVTAGRMIDARNEVLWMKLPWQTITGVRDCLPAVDVSVVKREHFHKPESPVTCQEKLTTRAQLAAVSQVNLHRIDHMPNIHHIFKGSRARQCHYLRNAKEALTGIYSDV